MEVEQNVSNYSVQKTPTKESSNEIQHNSTPPPKFKNVIVQWDDYFMFLALLSAKRSKDPITQVGACIVDNENRIVAIGYNGLPRNCHDDEFPWGKSDDKINDKKMYVVHAEANAILNKNLASISGMRLYTTLFPCNECSKLIIQSGIGKILYLTDKYENKPKYQASKRMFNATGVKYNRLEPQLLDLKLDFEKIIEADPLSPFKKLKFETPMKNEITTKIITSNFGHKRNHYIHWDDYFMAIALLSAKRSKDPKTQVGSCIVDSEQRVVAIGYNGLPRNYSDSEFPWENSTNTINEQKLYVVHAEANAILNKNSASLSGMRLYTTLFPCNECTKLIIQSGIRTVYYLSDEYEDKPKYKAAKRMLEATGICYKRFEPVCGSILLDFEEIIRDDPSTPIKRKFDERRN